MYLVVECSTTSAPSAKGRCSTGEAKVLSTTTRTERALAIAEMAEMSANLRVGLVGVSNHTKRVVGLNAASNFDSWLRSTKLDSSPNGFITLSNRRKVPPYTSSPEITWSPGFNACKSVVAAAQPLENAKPRVPPSSTAKA